MSAKRKARLDWEAHHIELAPRKTPRSKRPTKNRRRRDHSSDSGLSLPTERNQKRSCMSGLQSPTKRPRCRAPQSVSSTEELPDSTQPTPSTLQSSGRHPPNAVNKLVLPRFKRTSQLATQSDPVAVDELVPVTKSTSNAAKKDGAELDADVVIVEIECARGQELYQSITVLIKQIQLAPSCNQEDAKDDMLRYVELIRLLEGHRATCLTCCADSCAT
ncbi:hypothetical protein BMF94_3764 [Rhodotorula taiwanensis]|uniref:Uncharacterized protein n=1 Tax=Rhodotorula taiwanensis TaxID=741276 RepID=A0A2S5B9H3_9BASI|nr:hypothetical protein BMF94_3764 [Rhodotorula taiwanensis]